ncbi:MAG TPA: polysaccharide biosynthesis tyrosine autokinase [Xanthobacteraceae bacterium]|jgi:succinoglycan biosynthesis transport protein ExoP|nr:polysaccharide biosynthesis tyrosine autokinase [Xanthobacteraceae bacterium]
MLQTSKLHTVPEQLPPGSQLVSPAEIWRSTVGFLRRQYFIIAAVTLLVLALGVTYLFTTPPSYTAHAMLMIDARKVQLFQQPSVVGDAVVDSSMVESQVELLKSENVALSVIKDLHLAEDPEFVGGGGGFLGAVFGFISGYFGPEQPPSEFELTRRAVGSLLRNLSIKRVGLTYVIDIGFRSLNPDRAAQIANAVADAYIVDQLDAKYEATKRASVWLQDRINELRQQASGADRAVVDFKAKNNIVDAGGRLLNEQQLAELNSQLVAARGATSEAKARLDRIDEIIRSDDPGGTVTDTLRNDVVSKLRSQYLDLAAKEADWSARYGSNHLAAVNLRNQMREIRRSILDELKRLRETYKSDYEIAKQREESLQKDLSTVVAQSQTANEAQVQLRDLESSSQTYRALYDNFLQRYMESVQQQSFPITEARLISRASHPLKPSHPQTLLILALAMAGGLGLGVGVGILRDISDRVFRTSGQLEEALQVNCIAVLPLLARQAGTRPRLVVDAKTAGPRTIVRHNHVHWTVVDEPFSRYAEAVRSIKVSADLHGVGKSNRVIGFTSSLPNEGKSTVAASLALLIAQAGGRVILVDCDLRNPSISRDLTPEAREGLLEVVNGKVALEDAIWTDPTTKLAFLPTVVQSRVAHTDEILASDQVKTLFERLREKYQYVVVDLSPLAPVVDVRTTAHLVDSYVFVVEWGRTKTEVVEHAINASRTVYENLLGAVLNKVQIDTLARYEGHGGTYYRNKYYSRYGYTD